MDRSHHRGTPNVLLSILVCGLVLGGALLAAPANAAHDWTAAAFGTAADTAAYDVTDAWRTSGDPQLRRSAYVADRLNSPLAYNPATGEAIDRWQGVSPTEAGRSSDEYQIAFLGTGLGGMVGQAALGAAPTLTFPAAPYNDGVDPDSGNASPPGTVTFRFRVIYRDTDGDTPTTAQVRFYQDPGFSVPATPASANMTLISGSAADGTYNAAVALQAGRTYYFQFNFVNNAATPETVTLVGTNPVVVNAIPALSNQANTPPNPATPVTDQFAQTTISCRYTDADNDAPSISEVTVYRASGAALGTYDMSPTGFPPYNYVAGVNFSVSVQLPAGDHYRYRFRFSDGTVTINDPQFPPYHGVIDVAASPILLNPTHTILDTSITEPTRVRFNVTYKEADAEDFAPGPHEPAVRDLHVYYFVEATGNFVIYNEANFTFAPPYTTPGLIGTRSNPYDMSPTGAPVTVADIENGQEYSATIALHRPGLYYYTFRFENADNSEEIREPLGATIPARNAIMGGFSDTLPGGNGIEITRAPSLSYLPAPYNDGADPNDGDGDPTTVTFRVRYTDPDEEPPTLNQVHIYTDSGLTVPYGPGNGGAPQPGIYHMNKIAGDPVNGETYSITLDLPSPGRYYYFFVFDNATYHLGAGPGTVLRLPATDYQSLVLVNQPPILSNYSLNPTSGRQADTYTFTVDYTDYDGNPPADTDGMGNPIVLLQIEQLNAAGNPINTQQLDLQQVPAGAETWNDGNYTNGERFTITVRGIDPVPGQDQIGDGGHRFYFETSDGDFKTVFPAGADTTPANRLTGPRVNDPPNAVAGGFDPSGGQELLSTEVRPEISWNAAGDINATDPPSTLRYRVELSNDGFASVFTQFTTAAGVTEGSPTTDLTPGDWSYRIYTIDDSDAESPASAAQTFHLNGLPMLSAGQVDPVGPDPTDWTGAGEHPAPGDPFSFQVIYTDVDDDAPASIDVVIQNGTTQTFALAALSPPGLLGDGDYTNGELYGATIDGATIGDGTDGVHAYYFKANDGLEDAVNHIPAVPEFEVNDAPNAVAGGFDPPAGDVHLTPEQFGWDASSDPNSSDPPATLRYRIEIDRWSNDWRNADHTFTTAAGQTTVAVPGDWDLTLETGTWYWRVVTIDDGGAETPSAAQTFNLVDVEPVLALVADPTYAQGVNPQAGRQSEKYMFKVNYSDADNDPPSFINVVVTNTGTSTTTTHAMTFDSYNGTPDYVGGEDFKVELTGADIGDGEHTFYFEASDGQQTVQLFESSPPDVPFDGPTLNDAPNAPTAGFDPRGGEILAERRPTISWNAATDINPSDTPDTLRYRVEFSRDAGFATIEGAYTFTTAEGVTTGAVPQPLANGTWYYRVITIDDSDAESAPSATQQFAVQVGQTPVLSNPVLTPASGGEADLFTFEVTYSDPNNDPPVGDQVQVYVSGVAAPFNLQEKNDPPYDYTAGVEFTLDIPGALMGDGEHTHYFSASDGISPTVTLPIGGGSVQLPGPSVNDPPNPPTTGFDPAGGETVADRLPTVTWTAATDPNSTDTAATLSYRLEFSATNAPFTIEPAYTVTTAPGDNSVPPAAELPNGTWYYRVITIDDQGAESVPSAVQTFVVHLNTPPVLSNPSVNPTEGGLSAGFTFEVTFTDADGDAPAVIQVIVTNTETDDVVTRNMSPRDPGPYDFTAGVVYRAQASGTLLVDGEHTHYFTATDGTDAVDLYQAPPAVEFEGPLVNDPPNAPTSGFDPGGGTSVSNRQPLIAWDAATDPNPTDPEDTLQYRIEFSRTPSPFTVEAVYTALSNVGVPSARPNAPLPEATQQWFYRVFTIDNSGAVSLAPSPVQMFVLDLNNPPEAPQPVEGYSPADGEVVRTSTPTFAWPAATDPDPLDTTALLRYQIQIDDATDFVTPLVDDVTAAGTTQYTVGAADALNLNAEYWWRVRTVDPHGAVSDWTEVALELPAPLTFTTALESVLLNPDVDPDYGTLATVFTFSVEYWDADNLPPAGPVQVVVGPGNLVIKTLARDLGGDGDFTNGELYRGAVTGNELGIGEYNHYFRINTNDPVFQVETAVQPGPVVGIDGGLRLTDSAWVNVSEYEEGDTVYIEVDDADENRDPAAVDTITVRISSEIGDSENVLLTETGVDTGIFRGQIATLGRAGASGNGVLNLVSGPTGTTISAIWTDPDAGPSAVDTALVTDTVAPDVVPPADITVTSGPNGTNATVNWSAFNEAAQIDIAGYHVWQSTSNFTNTGVATLVATTTSQSAVIGGLTPNTQYFFAVTPFDEVPNENTAVQTASVTTTDTVAPYLANRVPAAGDTEQPLDTNISFEIRDDGVGVDFSTIVIELDGNDITGAVSITPMGGNAAITYDPPADFNYNDTPQIHVIASDLDGNTLDTTYGFGVVTDVQAPQVANWAFGLGGTLTFNLTDDVSGVDMSTFVLQVDGVDQTANAVWDDSDPLAVSVQYAPAGGWPYSTTLNFAVDVSDFAGNAMATFTAAEDTEVDDTPPSADQFTPQNGATNVPIDTAISVRFRDNRSGVDSDTIVMTVNGVDVSAELDFGVAPAAEGRAEVIATYQPADPLDYDTQYDVHVEASDVVGNTRTADWSFTTGSEPTFEIRGTILDTAGNPMPGVQVAADGNIAITDGNGVYRLQGMLAGTYTLTPTKAEYDFEPASQDVTVGPDARDINFTGRIRTYSISGTVTRSGAGVQGVRVSDGTRSAVTDADGNYTITDVPNGVYTVTPTRDADNDGFEDFTFTPQTRTVNIEGANVADVDFTATPVTYAISGTISDTSGNRIAGVTVSDGTRTAVTNEAGVYRIEGVPAGTVTVTPTRAGVAFDPATRDVTVPPASGGNNFTAYREFTQRFQAGLRMVAVPATPPAGRNRAVDVFQTNAVARWDAMSSPQGYVFGRDNPGALQLEVRPGSAFFVNFPAVTDVTVPGDGVDGGGTFSVGVGTGWNQVGNPYETALPLANITGAGSTQIRPYAFIWDPAVGSYRMISRQAAFNSARTYIEAWEGAWFRATGAAGTLTIQAPTAAAATAMLNGAAADLEAPSDGWLLPIVARVADRADLTTVAGVGSGDAAHGYRVENPPMMPGSVDVYFTGDADQRLAHDIRPQSSATMVWPFAVETDIANAEVEITLPDLSGVPAEMAVYLTDVGSGKRMYARTLPAYTFTTGADGALRHFELEVAPRGADNLTIRTASVQAASGGMVVTYDLSTAASVNIEVLNIAGRSVRRVVQSRAVPAGINEQMWDMRSTDGTLVPNGSYLIKIEAVAENGQRVQALRPAQIAR